MVLNIQVEVFWNVTPCSAAVGYQWFEKSCCLHLKGEVTGVGIKGANI
jgi:hypothetical protein